MNEHNDNAGLAAGDAIPESRTTEAASCNFHGCWFNTQYPDAQCIDGFLWDEDSDDGTGSLTVGGDDPCPLCNRSAAIDNLAEALFDDGEATTELESKEIAAKKIDAYIESQRQWFWGNKVGSASQPLSEASPSPGRSAAK